MAVDQRVKFQDIVENQLPRYVRENFPLLPEFLKQYYISQEIPGGSYDLIQNLDQYVKVDELYDLEDSTILGAELGYADGSVSAAASGNFTVGFPENNGLLKIDDEIILYEYKTDTSFENCARGFSGITSYIGSNTPDKLVFSPSVATTHKKDATIYNLNVIFLQEFFKKIKNQFIPGFDERKFADDINQRNFVFNSHSFYSAKGTDNAFEILFKALYAANVEVIHPDKYLLRPSNADYKITKDFVVEKIDGDPLKLKNLTIFQKSTGARGSVTDVRPILYDKGQYYEISIDAGWKRDISVKGTIYKEFKPNPKTKLLNAVGIGETVLDVDSTIGFPETGLLTILDQDDNRVSLAYTGKSINQFFHISGINNTFPETEDVSLDDYSYAYVGINTDEQIRVRIGSTLKDLEFKEDNYFYQVGDTIRLQSIGVESKSEKTLNWNYNIKTNWEVKEIQIIDENERIYQISTYDTQLLKPGYNLTFENRETTPTVLNGTVSRINSSTSFVVKLSGKLNLRQEWDFTNQILRGASSRYPYIKNFVANVQNTYVKPWKDEVLVTSNSLPNYNNVETNPYDRKITYSGRLNKATSWQVTTDTDHGFYTGDTVYYKPGITNQVTVTPDGITFITPHTSRFETFDEGVYFVSRENSTNIRLARSKGDLYAGEFVELTGDIVDNQIIYFDYYKRIFDTQKICRQILPPDNKSGNYVTDPGYTGILNNGVEIVNYKSPNSTVYYGDIQSFEVNRGGYNYDVINPPRIVLNDEVGVGATGIIGVSGQLERIDIVEPGYDYIGDPVIIINGGNGVGAAAEPSMTAVEYKVPFNATEASAGTNGIGLTTDTIGFTTFHKFRDYEEIVYESAGQNNVVGLVTDSSYYVSVVGNYQIKLHNNFGEAVSGVNTIGLTGYGEGVQFIRSVEVKRKISGVVVTNPGSGYQNKKRTLRTTAGVTTSIDRFTITNHGYENKEIVKYTGPLDANGDVIAASVVTGLSDVKEYYVIKYSADTFSLSEVGIGSTGVDHYYDNNILVDLISDGLGSFNYPPITATVEGVIGVSTAVNQDFRAVLQPIFRGEITSVDLTESGVGYGASEIINFDRQPLIEFENGELGQCTPVINNGQITQVLIDNRGRFYHAPPDIEIKSPDGSHARLTPLVDQGKISEIKVISGGAGYVAGSTQIVLVAPGKTAQVTANIRSWSVNLFERNFNTINDDDGILEENIDDSSLEYSHIYAPRPLRESTYSISGSNEDNTLYGTPDLVKINGVEVDSSNHSPILGWAYDGNPIYGPYGFANEDGSGAIVPMIPGYELAVDQTNRPPTTVYSGGFFNEDYVYTGKGHLDKHNGRFCITPDYPEGTYAYFSTINTVNDSSGPFENYRRPVFPYFVGESFKSEPNDFNFNLNSNQYTYDIQENEWLRNTKAYHTNDVKSGYKYIFNSNTVKEQTLEVKRTEDGKVDNVGVVTGGTKYKIGDRVEFDNTGTSGRGADVRVESVGGQKIDTISLATRSYSNVEFVPARSRRLFVGIANTPHNLITKDIIRIAGLSTNIAGFAKGYSVGVSSEALVLLDTMAAESSTGKVVWARVGGSLARSSLRENDILNIDQEKVKILNKDLANSRLRILRSQYGTTGLAHTNSAVFYEDPRRFSINVGSLTTETTWNINREIYFNPVDHCGTGTAFPSVGIGTTVTDSSAISFGVGAGLTQYFVPTRSLWFAGHSFQINDEVSYSTNGGSSIKVWTGISNAPTGVALTMYETLYASPINENLVGLSSTKVGMGTTGHYVGINTISGLLYFTGVGVGNTHSFTTRLKKVITGDITQNVVTVSTGSSHQLVGNDQVTVSVKPIGFIDVVVKYNDYNRRIVFDPQDFVSGDIDVSLNTITVSENIFELGDKVIHTASTSSGGLNNEGIYYVIPYTKTSIRLVEQRTELQSKNPAYVDITSASAGTLSKINPPLLVKKNEKIKFNLSDSSLSFENNGTTYPAFELKIYSDKDYSNQFLTSKTTSTFEVTQSGQIGIDADAHLTIDFTNETPNLLYYKFELANISLIPLLKKELQIDTFVPQYNQINARKTYYDGIYNISASGIGSTTFDYNIPYTPDTSSYNYTNSVPEYTTISKTAEGPIVKLDIRNGGTEYREIPKVTGVSIGSTVRSGIGSGAILKAETNSIGKIAKTQLNGIGFDYPTDATLKVIPNLPDIIKVDRLNTLDSVGVTSQGRNYLVSPDLVVLDGYTNEQLFDVDLSYDLGEREVKIIKNVEGIYDLPPRIIPVGNSNGVGIRDLLYSATGAGTSTGEPHSVRLYMDREFSKSEDFESGGWYPGEKFLLENVSVGVGSTGKGYNSGDYGFHFWTITASSGQIGGSNAFIEFTMKDVLKTGDIPGKMDTAESAGRLVLQNHFPIYETKLKQNQFFKGEKVEDDKGAVGTVERWNPDSETLVVSIQQELEPGTKFKGLSSHVEAYVESNLQFDAEIATGAGATVVHGWQTDSGMLNSNFQKLPDNEYYQRFSYALKSLVPIDKWDNTVSNLSHISGFARFGDLVIESQDPEAVITRTEPANFELVIDIDTTASTQSFSDFDYVSEITVKIQDLDVSRDIIFANRIITDYYQSVGNRVLAIDNFSDTFNSQERPQRWSAIAPFYGTNDRFNKCLTFVKDEVYSDERQFSIVSLLQHNGIAYVNEYATLETYPHLGTFDYNPTKTGWDLTFVPVKAEWNQYDASVVSISLKDNEIGIGSTALGNAVSLASTSINIPYDSTAGIGSTTTIATIPQSWRSTKIISQLEDNNELYYGSELNIINNGSSVSMMEYGDIQNTGGPLPTGFGTYHAYVSGGNVLVDFIPNFTNSGIALTCNASMMNVATGSVTGVGSCLLEIGRLTSNRTQIAAGSTGTIASYGTDGSGLDFKASCGYYFVSIEGSNASASGQYECLEACVLNSASNQAVVEFGNVGLGTVGLGTVGISSVGNNIDLTFTPRTDAAVNVSIFGIEIQPFNDIPGAPDLDLNNLIYYADRGRYVGTKLDLRTSFGLKHNELDIFRRQFDGNSSASVNPTQNVVKIPDHYFVTGEKLTYSYTGTNSTNAVSIETTTVPGVGSTDKLPKDLYAVVKSQGELRFATTAENALKTTPVVLEISAVGIGTSHHLTADNQNSKALVAIDNIIQSPIAGTAVTSGLSEAIVFDQNLPTVGITSFAANDLIKIDNEIIKVTGVGVGGTQYLNTIRAQMGTTIDAHSIGSTVTKLSGEYNIVYNTIHFSQAPYGKTPLSTTTDPDQRDWAGITTHSTFQGRTFMRTAPRGAEFETYSKNMVLNDISDQFTGITSYFNLTAGIGGDETNAIGFGTDNAVVLVNNIFQEPTGIYEGSYDIVQTGAASSITFTGEEDATARRPTDTILGENANRTEYPVGGKIISVGSAAGFAFQPLIGAGGTAVVSGLGTISSISIGNTGSGYRVGVQTVVNVGVQTAGVGIASYVAIGTAAISGGHIVSVAITNPGAGYTTTNPPSVVIDSPLPYSNIPLTYSSASTTGVGQSASIDIVVGQGSSVISFEIKREGFGFGNGEILTIPVGGTTGIPTDTTKTYDEFRVDIQKVYTDEFSGWTFGQLEVLDPIQNLFDGSRTVFRLSLNEVPVAIAANNGNLIDPIMTTLVFINNVLQEPNSAYTLSSGGGAIVYTTPPRNGDTCKVLFYKGTRDVDVVFTQTANTVKAGDILDINNNPDMGQGVGYNQFPRVVTGITSYTSDQVTTNPYRGLGLSTDRSLLRPVDWTKQLDDKVINDEFISKARDEYETDVYPTTYLIQPVTSSSTEGYVENVRPFFNLYHEADASRDDLQNYIELTSQQTYTGAAATAIVSDTGTITSLDLTIAGAGYTGTPTVQFTPPAEGSGYTTATATAALSSDVVTSLTVTNAGTGYTTTNPPTVFIAPPDTVKEKIDIDAYTGDYGTIVGFGTTTSGGTTQIMFDFWIPPDSMLRNVQSSGTGPVSSATTVSGITTSDYFTAFDTNLTFANGTLETRKTDPTVKVGATTSFLDCVYQVASAETVTVPNSLIGVSSHFTGITTDVRRVFCNVAGISSARGNFSSNLIDFSYNLTGVGKTTWDTQEYLPYTGIITHAPTMGEFSWGKLDFGTRTKTHSYDFWGDNGILGISTSGVVTRYNPLRFRNYVIS